MSLVAIRMGDSCTYAYFRYFDDPKYVLHLKKSICCRLAVAFYQNPDDFPPGGFRTLIVARCALVSSSSAQNKKAISSD